MARGDRELFDRLRAVGLRKEVAKPLSAVGADARRTAVKAARAAIDDLRALADELERRLPSDATQSEPAESAAKNAPTQARRRTARATAGRTPRPRTGTRPPADAAAPPRAQAGGSRAAIVRVLGGGPMTASEIAAKTGISVSTVSSTVARMAKAGELVKAPRGYALPR